MLALWTTVAVGLPQSLRAGALHGDLSYCTLRGGGHESFEYQGLASTLQGATERPRRTSPHADSLKVFLKTKHGYCRSLMLFSMALIIFFHSGNWICHWLGKKSPMVFVKHRSQGLVWNHHQKRSCHIFWARPDKTEKFCLILTYTDFLIWKLRGDLEIFGDDLVCVCAYAIPLVRRCSCNLLASGLGPTFYHAQSKYTGHFVQNISQTEGVVNSPTKIESVHSRIPDVLYVHICSHILCTYPHDVNVVWVGKTHWRHVTVPVAQGEIARALTLIFLLTVLTCFDVWAGYQYAKGLGASSWITGSIALALQMSLLTLPFSSHLASGSQKPCEFWSSKRNTSGHLAVVAEKLCV